MEKKVQPSSKFSSFKIILLYAAVSAVYIYTSDYFLEIFTSDVELLTKLQTVKGLVFILVTAGLLYILVKRNIDKIAASYQEIIDVKQQFNKQLSRSKEEYTDLFNHSPLPMWLFDAETLQILHVNEAACSHYGYSQEDYLTMTLKDIRPDEDIPLLEEMLANSLKKENSPLSDVIRHRKKNGEIMQVKVKTTYVTFDGKQVRLASAVDVTSEMQTQAKLIVTNARLHMASELASLGYWTNDLVTSKIVWSDEIYKIFEVDPNTFPLTIDSIKERFHPEDRQNFGPTVYTNFDENGIIESERRIITDSGKTKWLLERIHLSKDKEGNPIGLEGIVLDITKRKKHDQEIWESNERFKILTKATVEAIIDWDINNDTVFWGEGFHTMLGYDLSLSDNYLWQNNIHPDDKEKVLEDLNQAIKDPTKNTFNAEFRFLKANRDIAYVQHKGILIRDANGRVTRALAAMIDLTETLERMNKIELQNKALKDITWTQSHVVRAPLANLLGLITLFKENTKNGKHDDDLVEYINASAQQLDTIIRDIVKKSTDSNDM